MGQSERAVWELCRKKRANVMTGEIPCLQEVLYKSLLLIQGAKVRQQLIVRQSGVVVAEMNSDEMIQAILVETDDNSCRTFFADGLGDTVVSRIQSQAVCRCMAASTATEETCSFDRFAYFQMNVSEPSVLRSVRKHTILGFLTLTLLPTIPTPTLVFQHKMMGLRDQRGNHADTGSSRVQRRIDLLSL